jgi:hypothetical protein
VEDKRKKCLFGQKEEKLVLKTKLKILFATLLVISMVTTAIAAIMVSKDVSTPFTIEGKWGILVLDKDKTTELTTLDLGILYRGDNVRFPTTGNFWIKNAGDYSFYVSRSVVGVPSEVTYHVWYRNEGAANWELLNDDAEIYPTIVNPGAYGEWYLQVIVGSTAPFGSYPVTLSWRGHDMTG